MSLDPDGHIQAVVRIVFEKFDELETVAGEQPRSGQGSELAPSTERHHLSRQERSSVLQHSTPHCRLMERQIQFSFDRDRTVARKHLGGKLQYGSRSRNH